MEEYYLEFEETFEDILSIPQTPNQIKLILNQCPTLFWGASDLHSLLNKNYPICKERYKKWYESKEKWEVGQGQLVKVLPNLWVLNFLWDMDTSSNDKLDKTLIPKIFSMLDKDKNITVHYLEDVVIRDMIRIEDRLQIGFLSYLAEDLSVPPTIKAKVYSHILPF